MSFIKSKIRELFYWFVNFFSRDYDKVRHLTKETNEVGILEYKGLDGKPRRNFYYKATDPNKKNIFRFLGFGTEDPVYNLGCNSHIHPPGGEEEAKEYDFQLLLRITELNHPNKVKLMGHSNGCNRLVSALEYIITQSTSFKMESNQRAWLDANPEEKQRMTNAQRILNQISGIELSKPYPHIGASCGTLFHKVGRKIVSWAQDENEETGYNSPTPIHYRLDNVMMHIKKQNPSCKATVYHATQDEHCGGYEFNNQNDKLYAKRKGLKKAVFNFDIFEIDENSHVPYFSESKITNPATVLIRNNNQAPKQARTNNQNQKSPMTHENKKLKRNKMSEKTPIKIPIRKVAYAK